MKKITTLISMISLSIMIFSQSFPLESSKWYYANNGGTQPPNSTLTIIDFEKDTLIHDTLSQKLSNGLFFYSHNDSIFYFNEIQNKFGLIYDFSANIKDTIILITPHWGLHDKKTFSIRIDTITKEVYDLDTIMKFHNTSLDPDFHFENNVYMTRIGASGFLPQWGFSIPEGDYLKCYEDESLNINYSGIPCDSIVTGLESSNHLENFEIYPNPAKDKITIISDYYEYNSIEIVNYLGKVVYKSVLSDNKTIFDVSILPLGLYLIRIKGTHNPDITKKIVIR